MRAFLSIYLSKFALIAFCMFSIGKSDIVVSLLPFVLHGVVAEKCIETKTNMVTASYITDHVRSLNQLAKDAGVTILNEVGLDPGEYS